MSIQPVSRPDFFGRPAICEIIVSYLNLSMCRSILVAEQPNKISEIFQRILSERTYANSEDVEFLYGWIKPLHPLPSLNVLLQTFLPKLEIFNFTGIESQRLQQELAPDPEGAYLIFKSRAFLGCLQLKDIGQVILKLKENAAFIPCKDKTAGIRVRDQLISELFRAAFQRLAAHKHAELIEYCRGVGVQMNRDPDPDLGHTLAVPKPKVMVRSISSH